MASSRHYVVLLAALAAFVLVTSAFATGPTDPGFSNWSAHEPSTQGNGAWRLTLKPTAKNPDSGHGDWSKHGSTSQVRSITLPVVTTRKELTPPSSADIEKGEQGYYEASITLKDTSLPASASLDVVSRRLGDVLSIAGSGYVTGEVLTNLSRDRSFEDAMAITKTIKVTPFPDTRTVRITARANSAGLSGYVVRAITYGLIDHVQELDRSPEPLLITTAAVKIRHAGTKAFLLDRVLAPVKKVASDWLSLILVCAGIILAVFVGRTMGIKQSTLKWRPLAAVLAMLVLVTTLFWGNITRYFSDQIRFTGSATLLTHPLAPPDTSAEIMKLTRSKIVLDNATRTVGLLGITTTPKQILAGLKIEQSKKSNFISIRTNAESRDKAAASADALAAETVMRYNQLHGNDTFAKAVQKFYGGHVLLPSQATMKIRFLVLIPMVTFLLVLLITYPISYRMARKRRACATN